MLGGKRPRPAEPMGHAEHVHGQGLNKAVFTMAGLQNVAAGCPSTLFPLLPSGRWQI